MPKCDSLYVARALQGWPVPVQRHSPVAAAAGQLLAAARGCPRLPAAASNCQPLLLAATGCYWLPLAAGSRGRGQRVPRALARVATLGGDWPCHGRDGDPSRAKGRGRECSDDADDAHTWAQAALLLLSVAPIGPSGAAGLLNQSPVLCRQPRRACICATTRSHPARPATRTGQSRAEHGTEEQSTARQSTAEHSRAEHPRPASPPPVG